MAFDFSEHEFRFITIIEFNKMKTTPSDVDREFKI